MGWKQGRTAIGSVARSTVAGANAREQAPAVLSLTFGGGFLLTGAVLYTLSTLTTLGKILLFWGAGWLARDSGASILSRAKRSSGSLTKSKRHSSNGRSKTRATTERPSESESGSAGSTDEDDVKTQILEFVDENGGWMRQKWIATEIDRSKATVSKHVSQLANEEELVKVSRGRENIIFRADAVPEHVSLDEN